MSFAETYLSRYASRQVQELPDPDTNLFLVVVIPVFNEPGFIKSLSSLINADPPGDSWEIIVVVNEPESCPPGCHEQNLQTIKELRELINCLNRPDLRIHILTPEPFTKKKAGPGMARKIGMDESVRRFNGLNKPRGILVSFDADTTCSSNYLTEIKRFYRHHPEAGGCTVYFEHDLPEVPVGNDNHLNAIVQYELYLRYFKMALKWIGYPYANYALGSAFSIRAQRYVLSGGMGIQSAGEDFYFLQKCLPHGNFWELNTVTVFPSPRTSDRVLFGTGPFITDFIKGEKTELDVFPLEFFRAIRPFFKWINLLEALPSSLDELDQIIEGLPDNICVIMIDLQWKEKIHKAFEESAALKPFVKRFYHEISLLQLIRLLNILTDQVSPKLPVQGELTSLLAEMGLNPVLKSNSDLLHEARRIEKQKGTCRIS